MFEKKMQRVAPVQSLRAKEEETRDAQMKVSADWIILVMLIVLLCKK